MKLVLPCLFICTYLPLLGRLCWPEVAKTWLTYSNSSLCCAWGSLLSVYIHPEAICLYILKEAKSPTAEDSATSLQVDYFSPFESPFHLNVLSIEQWNCPELRMAQVCTTAAHWLQRPRYRFSILQNCPTILREFCPPDKISI
jgi:hypothetical protein